MATNGNGSTYSFPMLKANEIFALLHNMKIPVSEDDIRKCDSAAIRRIYEAFIESLMGVTKEEMSQPAFSGLSALNYPELHEDSIPELTFYRCAAKLMTTCGIHDFCMKDILAPTHKRLRRHLSAMLNFGRFRDERLEAFSQATIQAVRNTNCFLFVLFCFVCRSWHILTLVGSAHGQESDAFGGK